MNLVEWLLRDHAPGTRLAPVDVHVPVMLVCGHLASFACDTVFGCYWIPCHTTHIALHLYPQAY